MGAMKSFIYSGPAFEAGGSCLQDLTLTFALWLSYYTAIKEPRCGRLIAKVHRSQEAIEAPRPSLRDRAVAEFYCSWVLNAVILSDRA
jgi:hypothetical protein